MKKIKKNIFKLSVEEDEKIIFESLMDSFFNALANFVFDKKMNKGIEIVHKFDNAHFEDSKLPPNIKIIITPENKEGVFDKISGEYVWPAMNSENIN